MQTANVGRLLLESLERLLRNNNSSESFTNAAPSVNTRNILNVNSVLHSESERRNEQEATQQKEE